MPHYMTSFSYTPETWTALAHKPEDRSGAVAKLAESLGGRLIGLYYCMGDRDGFIITELPDDEAAAAAAITAAAAGHVSNIATTKLFTMEEMLGVMAKVGGLAIDPPGG